MTKVFTAVLAAGLLTAGATLAAEPDDLVLPEGFHATVFYDGSGPARHVAVRANGDVYLMTKQLGFGRPDPNKCAGKCPCPLTRLRRFPLVICLTGPFACLHEASPGLFPLP